MPVSGLLSFMMVRTQIKLQPFNYRKLAWSRFGAIAHVTSDSLGVAIRPLMRDPETNEYRLMEPTSLTLPTGQKFSKIAHISWNPNGSEIVVIDVNGRLCIYQTLYALNRVLSITTQVFEQADILGGIVGIEWLTGSRHVRYVEFLFCFS